MKDEKIVFITVLVLAAAGTVFAAGKIVFKTQFRKEVENLFPVRKNTGQSIQP